MSRNPPAPPGPRGLPYLGVALSYARDPLGYLLRLRERFGPGVVLLRMGPIRAFVVNEPELVEQVLVTDSRGFQKDLFLQQLGVELLGQGLLTSEGDFWRRQRRLAQPAFHRERIAAYGEAMVEAAEHLAARVRERAGERRDVHADFMELTLEIVTRTLFSADVTDEARDVGRALEVIMARYADPALALLPGLSRLPLPSNRRFATARARLDEIVYGLVQRRRESGADRPDLLGMLLGARDEDGSRMTDQQLRDEVITLFLAGHETTALALSFAFVLLSRSPEAERRLRAELAEVLGGRSPRVEDVPRLRYCECVVLESMRLYPPAWGLGREARRELELGGYRVPAGGQVWMLPWVIHRDGRFFPQPDRFRPERWEDGLQKRLLRYAYFPFGGGPRLCIGRDFALLEVTLLLATLAQRLRLRVERPEALRLLPSVTLRPRDPLWARVEAAS